MITRKNAGILLYLALMLCGILFVIHYFEEFINGGTGYAESTVPISLHDLPTVTLCFSTSRTDGSNINEYSRKYHYQEDFTIQHRVVGKINETSGKDKSITLLEDQNVATLFGLEIKLADLKLTGYSLGNGMQVEKCYKISSKWNGLETPYKLSGSTNFGVFLQVMAFSNSSIEFKKFSVSFTSEKNSYGAALDRYLEGVVQDPTYHDVGQYTAFKISQITENIH